MDSLGLAGSQVKLIGEWLTDIPSAYGVWSKKLFPTKIYITPRTNCIDSHNLIKSW